MKRRHTQYNKRELYHQDEDFKQQFEHIIFDVSKDKNHQGDINELEVALQHMRKGCKVYRNMGSTGHADMIIEYPSGEILKVDVKQLSINQGKATHKIGIGRSATQKLLNVRYVAVRGRKIYYVHHTKNDTKTKAIQDGNKTGRKTDGITLEKFYQSYESY
jgi:hypothetical protein